MGLAGGEVVEECEGEGKEGEVMEDVKKEELLARRSGGAGA